MTELREREAQVDRFEIPVVGVEPAARFCRDGIRTELEVIEAYPGYLMALLPAPEQMGRRRADSG